MEWEQTDNGELHRAKIPGGWLVKTYTAVVTVLPQSQMDMMDIKERMGHEWRVAMCFVPDPEHEWRLEEEEL